MTLKRTLAGLMTATALLAPALAGAETIKIGNTFPYSGPVSAYGVIGQAFEAYFNKVNAEGGINGNDIKVVTYDDAYTPPKTVEATRRLVERDRVLFIAGSLGSAHNLAVREYLNMKEVPQLFLATGAETFNDAADYPWTMGWQPSYQAEGKIYGEYVAKYLAGKKIGILYQNDDFGKDYLAGIKAGLGDAVKDVVAEVSFEVADPTVDAQVVNLQASGAEVFLNIATPKFAAQAIRKAHELSWTPVQIISTVAASVDAVLKPAGLEASQGLITAVYLKEPSDEQWADDAGMKDYQAFLNDYLPNADKNSVFPVIGYSIAQTTEAMLKMAGDDLSRENIMKQASSFDALALPMLVPGSTISTSATDHAPIESMQLVRFTGEEWKYYTPEAQ